MEEDKEKGFFLLHLQQISLLIGSLVILKDRSQQRPSLIDLYENVFLTSLGIV